MSNVVGYDTEGAPVYAWGLPNKILDPARVGRLARTVDETTEALREFHHHLDRERFTP